MNDDAKRSKGSSINRVLEIIELIATSEKPVSPADISFTLSIPKPSIHRLLQQMEVDGFIRTDWRGLIIPGTRMLKTAVGALNNRVLQSLRQSILQRLAAEVGETCGIAIPFNLEMLYTDRMQSNYPLQIYLPVGSKVPLWCTSGGKLYLSTLNKTPRNRLINNIKREPFTRNSVVDKSALVDEIERIIETGVSYENEEFIAGMVACSVAITDPDGCYFASLYIHAPTMRRSLKDLEDFVPQMRKASADLSLLLKNATDEDYRARLHAR